MKSPPHENMTPEQRREAYAKVKKRALDNVLGCFILTAFCLTPILFLGLLTGMTDYKNPGAIFTIAFARIGSEYAAFAWVFAFSVAIGAAAATSLMKVNRLLMPLAVVVFLGFLALPFIYSYRNFVIVAVNADGQAELRYLWPRPSFRIKAEELGVITAVETNIAADRNKMGCRFKWYLQVEAGGTTYSSMNTSYGGLVIEAHNRLQHEKFAALVKSGNVSIETLTGLGDAAFNLEQFEEARDNYIRANDLLEKKYGAESLELAHGLLLSGYAHHELKDYAKAEVCYKRALAIQRIRNLEGHMPDAQDAAMAYSRLLYDTGRALEDNTPKAAYTIYTDLIRQYGEEGAKKKIDEMINERRKRQGGTDAQATKPGI